jgi:hypothetical protein
VSFDKLRMRNTELGIIPEMSFSLALIPSLSKDAGS